LVKKPVHYANSTVLEFQYSTSSTMTSSTRTYYVPYSQSVQASYQDNNLLSR